MLENKKRVNADGEDSYLFYQARAKWGPTGQNTLGTEKMAGRKLPCVDASGRHEPGGAWVRVGWYPSGWGLVRAGTARVDGCSWESRAELLELGILAEAFNERDHN